ncbi:chalcone isomerase family protein [Chitiniphilus purpureus]|uniref:Chalcone isomerase family protein n=1 Tax=Chitiniphilus purpureus TaxID=2981137 RepID=A0ABY6DQB1_9NEIS|nr:chalcone isomerase family protein [Chitiniphilus sp. CD1]UXY14098.1 chalcone isomerase family protein [Chitiniphilus sp. CD1]
MTTLKQNVLAAVLVIAVAQTQAVELAGQQVPDSVALAGQSLVLNGAGVRTRIVVDVYVAALYTSARTGDAQAVLQATLPRRMELRMLRDVAADAMHESLVEGLADNVGQAGLGQYARQLDALDKVFREVQAVQKGDVIQLDFLPSQGTRITVRGKRYPVIAGDDFAAAMLSIWLGNDPVQGTLKRRLLGG